MAAPKNELHYDRLKMKQGSRATAKKRQILHRPLHCESDSSSSLAESNDSLSGQDSNRHKEKEHYNKLKVNIDSISRNKVLSGKIHVQYYMHGQSHDRL